MVELILIILIIIVMLLLVPWFMSFFDSYYDWVVDKWDEIKEKRNKDE